MKYANRNEHWTHLDAHLLCRPMYTFMLSTEDGIEYRHGRYKWFWENRRQRLMMQSRNNKAFLVISKVYFLRCTMLNYNICKISTGDFRIVPINWFSENNATFQWPPYENINEVNTAICNMCVPESDWDEISLDKILMSKGK